jgi:hypothetical protein
VPVRISTATVIPSASSSTPITVSDGSHLGPDRRRRGRSRGFAAVDGVAAVRLARG